MVNPCLRKLLQHMLEISCYLVKASICGCVSTCCDVGQVWGRRDLETENGMWGKESGERELGEVREKKLGQKGACCGPRHRNKGTQQICSDHHKCFCHCG